MLALLELALSEISTSPSALHFRWPGHRCASIEGPPSKTFLVIP